MVKQETVTLPRGVFTLSLDFELLWGTVDLFGPEGFRRACQVERDIVIDRLLDLLVEFDVPATWFTVGHLMLGDCDGKHPEIVRPSHSWHQEDWFRHDPGGTEREAPEFLGRSLVEKILACPVRQEVGCHSFSHVIFGDPGCSREAAASELAASVQAAESLGLKMQSFAFPRNLVGHLDLLREHGFTAYRGPDPQWGGWDRLPVAMKRLANLWHVLVAAAPPTVVPEMTDSGLWNIPGSMVYFPAHGLRRHIPAGLRVRRAVKGLTAAARQRRIFHLWFHPTNLADQTEEMFCGLRGILEQVRRLRERGELDVLPVEKVVPAGLQRASEQPGMLPGALAASQVVPSRNS